MLIEMISRIDKSSFALNRIFFKIAPYIPVAKFGTLS